MIRTTLYKPVSSSTRPLITPRPTTSVIEQNPVFPEFLVPEQSRFWHTDCVTKPSIPMWEDGGLLCSENVSEFSCSYLFSSQSISPWPLLLNGRIPPADYTIASWMNLSTATTRQR